jgi:hypothetical protein
VYKESPIRAAMLLTGEHGPRSERGFAKKLEMLEEAYGHETGTAMFRQCLSELRADLLEDRPVKNPGAVLQGKLKDCLPKTQPSAA